MPTLALGLAAPDAVLLAVRKGELEALGLDVATRADLLGARCVLATLREEQLGVDAGAVRLLTPGAHSAAAAAARARSGSNEVRVIGSGVHDGSLAKWPSSRQRFTIHLDVSGVTLSWSRSVLAIEAPRS